MTLSRRDFVKLAEQGADAISPSGTTIPAAAVDLLTKRHERLAE